MKSKKKCRKKKPQTLDENYQEVLEVLSEADRLLAIARSERFQDDSSPFNPELTEDETYGVIKKMGDAMKKEDEKKKIPYQEITPADYLLREYEWTKISKYALTDNDILVRYEGDIGDKVSTSFYVCLHEGKWIPTAHCVGIRQVAEAKPISEEEASRIIKKEAK